MSANNEHINSSDFKKYFSDKSTASDKALFEENVAEGSFEAEALEGFNSVGDDAAVLAAIQDVEKRVMKKTGLKSEDAIVFPIWKAMGIAASVLLFVGLGFFVSNSAKQEESVAMNDSEKDSNFVIEKELDKEVVNSEDEFQGDSVPSVNLEDLLEEEPMIEMDLQEVEAVPPALTPNNAKPNETAAGDYVVEREELLTQENVAAPVASIVESNNKETSSSRDKSYSGLEEVEYETIERKEKAPAKSYFSTGKLNFNSQDYSSAITYFQNAINSNQNVEESTYYIALSYHKMDKNVKANKYFDLVLTSNSAWVNNAKWYKALIYEEKGDVASAKALLQELAQGDSGFKNQAADKLKGY